MQNFFLDNKEWNYVEYDYSDIKSDIPCQQQVRKDILVKGQVVMVICCLIYIKMVLIYIVYSFNSVIIHQLCVMQVKMHRLLIECGLLGAVENFGGDEINKGGPREGGKYYTIGPACGGGDIFDGTNMEYKIQQCNYEEDEGNWAWQNAGYHYGGSVDPKLKGSFCGDPMGYYAKDDNKWLNTKRSEDLQWLIETKDNSSNDIKLGGIYNTILIMLMAKCYQPNAIIAYGTVPPAGGNCNLSATMVIDYINIY